MKRFKVTLPAVAAAIFAHAVGDIGGKYKVEGTNFDGPKSSGDAKFTITSVLTCTIKWQTGQDSSSVGICMHRDDSFAATHKLEDSAAGLIMYNNGQGWQDG